MRATPMGRLRAGFAQVDITPPLTIPYLGFAPRHAYFTGVHDPLHARALALETEDCSAIIISADAIGFDNRILGPGRHFTAEVRERVAERTGVPPERVMLTCTHAHSTPETLHFRPLRERTGAAAWLEVLMDQLASAAAMAWQGRRPREVRVGSAEAPGLAYPRRAALRAERRGVPLAQAETEYPLDRHARVLLLTDAESGRHIVLAHYACHPVTVQVQPLVSADFPGVATALVARELPGCEGCLFLQGCDGDVNPPQVTTRFEDVTRYGLMLGGGVLEALGAMLAADCPRQPEALAVAGETVHLPSRPLPDPAGLNQRIVALRAGERAAAEVEKAPLAGERRMLEEQLMRVSWGDAPVPVELQGVRLGEAAILGVSGEPFAALGLEVAARSPAAMTLVTGYANGYAGYLAPPEAWEEGGYEVAVGPWSQVGPEGWEPLVAAAEEVLDRLWP